MIRDSCMKKLDKSRKDTKENIFSDYKMIVRKISDVPSFSFERKNEFSLISELYSEFHLFEWYGGFINEVLVAIAVCERDRKTFKVLESVRYSKKDEYDRSLAVYLERHHSGL